VAPGRDTRLTATGDVMGTPGDVRDVAWSPDGRRLYSVGGSAEHAQDAAAWAASGAELRRFASGRDRWASVDVAPGGGWVAIAAGDRVVVCDRVVVWPTELLEAR